MADSLKAQTFTGVIWSFFERFSVQGIQVIVMIVVARFLSPKEFGLVGMLAIFIAVSQSLVDSGFTQALIRKQNRTETDNSTIFYFNIIVSLTLYALLYLGAPYVSVFYNEPELTGLMRVLCLVVVINSFVVVQRAIYTAALDFKTQAKASLTASLISGGVGVYMAISGFGVWTLVWQQITNAGVNAMLLWYFSTWRPRLKYSWVSFKELFGFSSKLMISGLISTIYDELYSIILGKAYNATTLGYYTQAKTYSYYLSTNITGIIQRVTYPVLCSIQNDDESLRENFRKILKMTAFIIFPVMCGLAGVSRPFVDLLLGEKWAFAATIMIPVCLSCMWYPIHSINLSILQAKGRSGLFLKLEIIKRALGATILILSIPLGVVAMCYMGVISSILCLVINTYYTGKLIKMGFVEQLKEVLGSLVVSLLMFSIIYFMTHFIDDSLIGLFAGLITGVCFYLGVVTLFKFEEVPYLLSFKSLITKKDEV
jgi:O-antigen/teichoic acid export membrane protein